MSGSVRKRLYSIYVKSFNEEQRTKRGWRRFKSLYSSGEMKLTPK